MKDYFKFIVAVFGVTIATFGTLSAKALIAPDSSIRCSGDSGGCVKVQHMDGTSSWLVGVKTVVN